MGKLKMTHRIQNNNLLTSRKKILSSSCFEIKFFLAVFCLFPSATLLQGFVPFLNIVLTILLVFSIGLLYFRFGFSKQELLINCLIILLSAYDYVITGESLYNNNNLFYFPIFAIFFNFFAFRFEFALIVFKKNKKIFLGLFYLWLSLILISTLFPSSYVTEWGEISFVSFAGGAFRLAPTALFESSVLILLMAYDRKIKYLLFSVFPLICFFFSGSRTYFVLGVLSELILLYFFINNWKKFLLLLAVVCIISIPIFFSSSIYSKFLYTLNDGYYDFLGTFTSGRSVFWSYDLQNFFNTDILKQIFGCGYNFVYDINNEYFNALIWAHNDFIQILLSHGFLGLFLYLYVVFYLFFKTIKFNQKNNYFFLFAIFLIWFFNAFFNMFYTYFCSMLCFPIYLISYRLFFIRGIYYIN